MEKVKAAAPKTEKTIAEPDYTEKIKSQVLAKTGKPPHLERVEVAKHYNGNYRVNIWEKPEIGKDTPVTSSPRIRSSYYLKVSDAGEILCSNPPLAHT